MRKDHEQLIALFERALFALIQLLVAAALCKELTKGGLQSGSLDRVGVVAVVQEALIQLPEGRAEVLQEGTMVSEAWLEFLVMTKFMDPAQRQFCGERIELGGIVTEQESDHRVNGLGSVSSYCQSIFHALAHSGSHAGQPRREQAINVFFCESLRFRK